MQGFSTCQVQPLTKAENIAMQWRILGWPPKHGQVQTILPAPAQLEVNIQRQLLGGNLRNLDRLMQHALHMDRWLRDHQQPSFTVTPRGQPGSIHILLGKRELWSIMFDVSVSVKQVALQQLRV